MANCEKCGRELIGGTGEQSEVAKALGLTYCIECWLDAFYGSDRAGSITKVAQLGEDGKLLPEQMPEGGGGEGGGMVIKSGVSVGAKGAVVQVDFGTAFSSVPRVVITDWNGVDAWLVEVTATFFKWGNDSKQADVTIHWIATDAGNS